MLLSVSLFWMIAGLMVIYKIGMGEILTSMGLESAASGDEEPDSPFANAIYLFIVVMMWPLLWIEYNNINQ